MNTALVVAIIALAGSITSTLISVYGTASLQARRDARQILDTYRTPLLAACYELQARLYNILQLQFIQKYVDNNEAGKKVAAVDTTLYVFAQFFGWGEIIRQKVTYLQFPTDKQTRTIGRVLGSIDETFISDEYGSQFMIWRVEQRGLGERMIASVDKGTCIGYDTFLQQRSSMDVWLGPLEKDLRNIDQGGRDRLVELQHLLLDLVMRLDANKAGRPAGVDLSLLRRA